MPGLILGRDLSLDEFANLCIDLPQILRNFTAQVLINLENLKFGLGNLSARLCGDRDRLGAFAVPAENPIHTVAAREHGGCP
jgi:hypothetical protein